MWQFPENVKRFPVPVRIWKPRKRKGKILNLQEYSIRFIVRNLAKYIGVDLVDVKAIETLENSVKITVEEMVKKKRE